MTLSEVTTALLVPVPEADRVVDDQRRELDPGADWGIPAHVSVIFPFVPVSGVNDQLCDRLRDVVARVPAFSCSFGRTGWFGGEVLFLVPEPDTHFRRLTRLAHQEFPDFPPYGGAHADPVPHLTVGQRAGRPPWVLRRARTVVVPRLPVRAWIDRVWLMSGTEAPGSWRALQEFRLGDAPAD